MTKIQNSKPVYDLEERTFQYWNLRFICNLVLGTWNLITIWCFAEVPA